MVDKANREARTTRRWVHPRTSFSQLVASAVEPRPVVVMGLSDSNGFVRQAALEAADTLAVTTALPMVLLRLRDWVPEVRAAASQTWENLLARSSPPDQLSLLPLVAHLTSLQATSELSSGLASLDALLREGDGAPLVSGLAATDPRVRRYCFDALLRGGLRKQTQLFHRAFNDADPRIQEWAVSVALSELPAAERLEYLKLATGSTRGRVKLGALRALWDANREAAREPLEAALLARSSTVREFAIWALRQLGDFQPDAYYRARLTEVTGRSQIAAVLELGRWGVQGDGALLLRFLISESLPRLRAATLRSLYRLAPEAVREHYAAAMTGASRRVARVARDLMLADTSYPSCAPASEWARSGACQPR